MELMELLHIRIQYVELTFDAALSTSLITFQKEIYACHQIY